ncbi:MAG: ComEC family competence protein [Prevotellaceae bacterium]|jgi:competence protein ComEC|nr:ComEC family competence protein [Prevotellaceae bacterium]
MNLTERLRQIPFVRLTLALFAGIVWQVWGWGFASPALFIALGVALVYVAIIRRSFLKTPAGEWLYGFVILLCLFFVGVALVQQQKTQTVLPLDRNIWLQAEVCDNPILTDRYTKVEALVKRYAAEDDTATVREKVILYLSLDESQPVPVAGAKLYAHATLSLIPPPGNPDEFNYQKYLARRKIFASAFVQRGHYHFDNNLSFWKNIQYAPLHWQWWGLETFFDSPLGEKEYAVLAALTLGNKQWIDDDLRNSYVAAGAMHVLAVSGLHVGIIMVLLNFMTSFLSRRRKGRLLRNVLVLAALWMYAAIVGFSPSVTRATVMFSFVLIGQNMRRKMSIYNSLAASAFFITCHNPLVIFETGFQLSYGAVLGIVYFQPYLYRMWYVKNKFLRGIWALATVSFAAQMGTAPISLLNFHLFPNYFLLTNISILSLVGFIIYGGVAFLFVHQIPVVSTLVGYTLQAMLWLLNSIVELIESLPYSVTNHIYIDRLQMWLMVAIILLIALSLASPRRRRRWLWVAAYLAICIIGLRSGHQVERRQQKMALVYKVKNASYSSFITGNRSISLCDAEHLHTDFSFHIGHFLVKHGLAAREQRVETGIAQRDTTIGGIRCYNGFVIFENDIYKLLENETIDRRLPAIAVDCLIVSGAARMPPDIALRRYAPVQIVLDASVPLYRIRQWEEAVAERNIKLHVVRNDGAFVKNYE